MPTATPPPLGGAVLDRVTVTLIVAAGLSEERQAELLFKLDESGFFDRLSQRVTLELRKAGLDQVMAVVRH